MTVTLAEILHPNGKSQEEYDSLVGIDENKSELLNHLIFFFDKSQYETWEKGHFPKGFNNRTLKKKLFQSPLIILSGEVGCGKTALAHSVATPVAAAINKKVLVLETPSNLRGSGMVGELSARVTAAFDVAKKKVNPKQPGILIIDEADDLATSRSQNQAHHEDRAGLNVLIKQMDQLKLGDTPMAVILITNRLEVLDPAVVRRAELQLLFERPDKEGLKAAFSNVLEGTGSKPAELDALIDHCSKSKIPYSYSDILVRVGQSALRKAIYNNKKFGSHAVLEILKVTKPTPLLE